ncbi:MAG: putative zinc-binding protein [Desulfobacterales bacterium]|nr:putative zinc-binding protein [Desulfobacterales bacterium]
MTENCCEATSATTMLLPCSGGSNVGQLANRAAVELTTEGFGKIFCMAGIGGRISGFVQSAKDAESVIVIDGCEIGCGKATLQAAGVPLPRHRHLVVTEYGIEKNKDFNLNEDDVDLVKQAVKNATDEPAAAAGVPGGGSGCCS